MTWTAYVDLITNNKINLDKSKYYNIERNGQNITFNLCRQDENKLALDAKYDLPQCDGTYTIVFYNDTFDDQSVMEQQVVKIDGKLVKNLSSKQCYPDRFLAELNLTKAYSLNKDKRVIDDRFRKIYFSLNLRKKSEKEFIKIMDITIANAIPTMGYVSEKHLKNQRWLLKLLVWYSKESSKQHKNGSIKAI